MNIFKIPLYYISFNRNKKLEKNCKEVGFTNINYFTAIDGRKFKPIKLLQNKLITSRAYNDLITHRSEHSGIPSLGAIGCMLSHLELWKLCISKKLPYIIILENDAVINTNITPNIIKKITTILSKHNSIFVSSKIKKNKKRTTFQGTHFCIVSNGACKKLVKHVFPIDTQTDYYISHLDNIKAISLEGFKNIAKQKNTGSSTIQESIKNMCIKCFTPNNIIYYIIILIFIIFIIVLVIIFFKWWNTCRSNLKKCSLDKEEISSSISV